MAEQQLIRNFSIIAHIDHGKTTLSDRLLQICQAVSDRDMKEQMLDTLKLERERGITIKAQCVTLNFPSKDGKIYTLNFIDTPGHVDFSYEVSRSLYACEGALLIVDASQGVEAQSVANCYKAVDLNLKVLPVLNKIDLPHAHPEEVKQEITSIIGLDASHALAVSGKTGQNVPQLIEQLVAEIPPPTGDRQAPLQALIIDSYFDPYVGVVSLICVKHGMIRTRDEITLCSNGNTYKVEQLGTFCPHKVPTDSLQAGEIGYLMAAIKEIHGAPVGDTIVSRKSYKIVPPLAGFKQIQPSVYASLFPTDADQLEKFRDSLSKLSLNDSALVYEPEVSDALGSGFRCGFLGLLHMEIVQERLEGEFDLDLVTTVPSVPFQVVYKNGITEIISNPSKLPDPTTIDWIEEPIAEVNILSGLEYLGKIIDLCTHKRGVQKDMQCTSKQAQLRYEIPLSEIIGDFFDKLKSISHGYASFDFSFLRYQRDDLVKVDILVNTDKVDAMTFIAHRANSRNRALLVVEKLKECIPPQMFEIAIQAAIGGKFIARSTVKAMRKNVLAKCYGGDISRKKKLLEKQKAGKKRMKRMGGVDIPQEAFLAVMTSE